jgi:predicted nucleotidyltransferase
VLATLQKHDSVSFHKVHSAVLLGYPARPNARFAPGRKDFDAYLELVDHLETILARRIDLVTTEGLSRHLAASVLAEALDVALGA